MKKICVITSGRQDFGHLYWVMKDIEASNKLELVVFAPGNHHCIQEIMKEFKTVQMTPNINGIQDYGEFYSFMLYTLKAYNFNMVMVLGDRFETHAAATAALLLNISIVHLHGGESTKGAFDDNLRNSITMMADIHFTATEEYALNVINMHNKQIHGLNMFKPYRYTRKETVFVTGAPGLDWLTRAKLKTKAELQQGLSINLNEPFILACFHPVTKELGNTVYQANHFMGAISSLDEQILLVSPNTDPENEKIRSIAKACANILGSKIHIVENLDHLTYLSLLQYAEMMVGNSSSGIIEAASFNLPSITIGNRQEGRIKPDNVFFCPCETEAILTAIDRAREWNALVGKCGNPYGDGRSSEKIVQVLENL